MKLQKRLSDELGHFLNFISQGTPFALARYGDGEMMFIEGRPGASSMDGWLCPEKVTELGVDLLQSLKHKEDFYFYGISCDCAVEDRDKYLDIIRPKNLENLTLANLFVNVNYLRFRKFIASLDESVVLIISRKCRGNSFDFLKVKDIVFVGDDPVEFWENEKSEFLSELDRVGKYHNTLFLISAGPLACLAVHYLWTLNRTNRYVDVGSAIDELTHQRKTRPYQILGYPDSFLDSTLTLSKLYVDGVSDQNTIAENYSRPSITAILNGYRRPEKLKSQCEALQNQTVPLQEILVWYNDYPKYGYSAKEVLDQCKVALSNHNFGVWARFAYALNAKTEYICIFDDDTIPGRRWFENCLETLKSHEGLLGTVGLIYGGSPFYMDHTRHGWCNPNESVLEVDIVGHAWFFKREWLSTFWRELPPTEGHDFMGEDMHFSYTLQKYLGIRTYVPPHPVNVPDLWGSLKGYEFGIDDVALSMDGNVTKWDVPFNRLRRNGWKLIVERELSQSVAPEKSAHQSQGFTESPAKKYSLAIITNLYPPQELGGYGRSLADFADSLKARGHQIHVLTSNAPYLGPVPPQEEQVDRRLQLWGTYEGQTQALQDPNQISAIARHNDRVLREVIAQVKPDLCLVGNISFLGPDIFVPLLENQIPTIHHLGFAQAPYAPHEVPQHPLYHLATASDAVAQAVRDAGLGQLETTTIYPGALVRHYSRPTLPPRDKLRILYAGLVIQSKGAHTLLEALTILQQQHVDFECTIAGNAIHADYRAAIQQYLQQTGLVDRVRLVGHLERSQLADCFAQHNVFVFPSIQPEAFGIVQVEAMAAGLTVLSTGVGGASEVIEHGLSGLQFPPGDAAALAQALLSLPQDPDRWAHLAANGQAQAFAKFDIERSVDQLELKFEELLRRKAELSSPMVPTAPATPATDPYVQWLCDRLSKIVQVYKLDSSDPGTINLLRELRRQCTEFWQTVPPEQLQPLYQDVPGQAYRSLLSSGFQAHPLTETETTYLQTLTSQAAQQSLQSPAGIRAFLGVMLHLPAGKMKVEQAHTKLPAWLLPDYQAVFESPEALAAIAQRQPPTPTSAPAAAPTTLAEDMVFLNRMLGCANLYYIDPDEQSIVEELRPIRRQVAEFWLSVPGDRVEAVFQSEFGKRYRSLLQCGFQNEPLTEDETAFVQALGQRVAAGIEQPDGLKAFLGVMLYYPPGKMQVRDAATRLPSWLWPDYQAVFEVNRPEPLVPGTLPQGAIAQDAPAQKVPDPTVTPAIAPPPANALDKLEDRVFLNRLLGLTNLYEIDPTDTTIAAELREMRSQVTQLWLSIPDDRLEATFNSEFGRRYGSYLRSGFQREALTPEETQTLQQLAQQVAAGLEKPAGVKAFLGAMMYYPPGKMKVSNADQRLPGWLLPTYRAVFEEGVALPT